MTATIEKNSKLKALGRTSVEQLITDSWKIIAPAWPLKNLNAVNPLQGFETLPIEEALNKGRVYFEQRALPKPMDAINRETIKWLQAYFDDSQATIQMPLKSAGLFAAWRKLALYDKRLHQNEANKIALLNSLSDSPKTALRECLQMLKISKKEEEEFLKLVLTTLPGWSSYLKYLADWAESKVKHRNSLTKTEYLAIRVIMIYLLWPEAKELLAWHRQVTKNVQRMESPLKEIEKVESAFQHELLSKLTLQQLDSPPHPSAQLVFCIDVRSEPFRRAIESTGKYETFGYAGFFGVPVQITDTVTKESFPSCPVLLSPKHEVPEAPSSSRRVDNQNIQGYERVKALQKLYQSIKYSFATPFAMVEGLGIASGAWVGLRTLAPNFAARLKKTVRNRIRPPAQLFPSLKNISFENQCTYAENALRMIGLTNCFSSLIVFCGHGSKSENNAYASSLDCGACGGRSGASNARILAAILNRRGVREYLATVGICIPKSTRFVGAEHNTTTDETVLYEKEDSVNIRQLKSDLEIAQQKNSANRITKLRPGRPSALAHHDTRKRSQDWAQVRPEWGLAKNAAFIIGPRKLTQSLDLEGRCFLHSYDYLQDLDGKLLEAILTAPMVVAQWINTQYLFSTLDNVSYGGGSKITKNITGKIGVMQGNASDLMTGLSLQSVYSSDTDPYHVPQRLLTVVYASRIQVKPIIQAQSILQKLFGNGWVKLVCIELESNKSYFLKRDFSWEEVSSL